MCLDGVVPQAEPGLRTLLICLLLLGFNFILEEQGDNCQGIEQQPLCHSQRSPAAEEGSIELVLYGGCGAAASHCHISLVDTLDIGHIYYI